MYLAAHFFMIFGALFVFAIILIGILVLGVILLTIGLISRHLNKKKGINKRYPKVCIIIGGIFMVISLGVFGMFAISFWNEGGSKYNPDTYDPHTSTRIEDSEYCRVILQEVIRCLDENDVEDLKSMFSESVKGEWDLETDIVNAMKVYEGTSVSYDFSHSGGSVHVENGYYYHKGERSRTRNLITDAGKEYYIDIIIILADDESKNEGICAIGIKDPNDDNKVIAEIGDYY